MRTLPAELGPLQDDGAVKPFTNILTSELLLRWTLASSGGIGTMDNNIATSAAVLSSGKVRMAGIDGSASGAQYMAETNVNQGMNIGTGAPGRIQIGTITALRGSFDNSGNFFTATWSWGGFPVVKSFNMSGLITTYNTYTLPETMVNSSTFVRRVDAVCYTPLGVIVVIGCYDFTICLATQKFYLMGLSGGFYSRLDTIIQHDLAENYVSWWETYKAGSFAQAMATSDMITVISHDGVRPLKFHLRNATESALEPVIPIESDISPHKFIPTSVTKITDLYYLTGRMTRNFTDDTSETLEMYLTSVDGKLWSLGEFSSYIARSGPNIILPIQAGYVGASIYAYGGGQCWAAPRRYLDGSVADSSISHMVIDATLDHISSGGDQAQLTLHDKDVIPDVAVGRALTVLAGFGDSAGFNYGVKVGSFVIDQQPSQTTAAGRGVTQVSAIDEASWRLQSWESNTDIDRWSQTVREDEMKDESKILVKTSMRDVSWAASGFSSVALNDPFVGFIPTRDGRDGLAKMQATFTSTDNNSLSSVGFIFGGDDNNFNAFLIPKSTTWPGHAHTAPQVRRSNLKDSSWTFDVRSKGLWESTLTDAFATLTTHPNASASANDEYYVPAAFTVNPSTNYQFVMRQQGAKMQLFGRAQVKSAAGLVGSSVLSLISEYRFNEHFKQSFSPRSYWGWTCGTDVFQFPTPGHLAYSDVMSSMTSAQEVASFGHLVGTGTWNGSDTLTTAVSGLAGKHVLLTASGFQTHRRLSTGSSPYTATIVAGSTNVGSFTGTVNIYDQDDGDDFAYVDSGYGALSLATSVVGVNATVLQATGAFKTKDPIYGTCFIVSRDGTAGQKADARSDGVRSYFQSGLPSGTGFSYLTNPIGSGYNVDDSTPYDWNQLVKPSWLFEGDATSYGLPADGYFIVDDEIVRYNAKTISRRGLRTTRKVCWIPTYVFPLAGAAKDATSFRQWMSPINGGRPGDDPGLITNPIGLQVEFVGLNGILETANSDQFYVTGTTYVSSPDVNNTSSFTIDKKNGNEVRGVGALDWQLAWLHGRGQLGSKTTVHDTTSRLTYYPLPLTTPPPGSPIYEFIRVSRFNWFAGLYNSSEDSLRYVCNLAGVRDVKFRSKATFSGNITNSNTTLSNAEQNFVLDMNANIGMAGLRIEFRNSYVLIIQATASPAEIAAGRGGNVWCQLACSAATQLTIGGSAERFIEQAYVPVGPFVVGGTGASGSYAGDPSLKNNLRVVCVNNIVSVEMDGQLLWSFNLKDYDYVDGGTTRSCYFQTEGPVRFRYTNSSSVSATARLLELSDEVENHIIDMGQSGIDAMRFVTDDRHILSRSTPNGGIEFGKFLARDNIGALTENVDSHSENLSTVEPAGHIQMTGAEFGEHTDEAWMQANGYKFSMGSNRLLNTVSDSKLEARLQVRLSKESSKQVSITAPVARLELQPEDEFDLSYTAAGDAPDKTSETLVAGHVNFTITPAAITMNIEARKKYAL